SRVMRRLPLPAARCCRAMTMHAAGCSTCSRQRRFSTNWRTNSTTVPSGRGFHFVELPACWDADFGEVKAMREVPGSTLEASPSACRICKGDVLAKHHRSYACRADALCMERTTE